MTYFAYLDEFGHIGPYVSRADPRYKESPVFGLAGFVLPAAEVRGFGTWFFQRKCEMLEFEITRSGEHPAVWEKKGASLFTVINVTRYRELRKFTNRLFNKIEKLGGFVFYVGIRKTTAPDAHNPNRLYARVLLEAIKRIDEFCEKDRDPRDNFIVMLVSRAAALVPANKKKDPRYTGIYRDMPGYSGMGPRRLRPMIVGVPLEPGVGGMGGEYDIDAEGVDGGGPDPIDGVVADGAGAVDAASPAGVCGVKAFGDLLGEGPGIGPAGGVVADLGGDLARHRPQRRHLDPARRSARRGRFITPRL